VTSRSSADGVPMKSYIGLYLFLPPVVVKATKRCRGSGPGAIGDGKWGGTIFLPVTETMMLSVHCVYLVPTSNLS